MSTIRISNGWVLDPATDENPRRQDLWIRDGLIVDPSACDMAGDSADLTIDAAGLTVMPGLIDAHCHLRDPGQEYREDLVSATRAAARGGYTTITAMPNTVPVCDHAALVHYLIDKAATEGFARVLPIGAVSKGQQGRELAEIGLMAEAGAVAISDDGKPVATADLMRKAMQYASAFGLTVIDHCEDLSLAEGGHMNEGIVSTELGLRGIPDVAESAIVARDCLLAEYLDLPVHLAHLSSRHSLRIVREAKRRGVRVTAETCPHYFTLTEEACRGFDTNAKMNPPLKTQADVDAVIEALRDGTLDLIATDHAPHHMDEKLLEFGLANNGIVGLESAFALGYTFLVLPGHLTLTELVRKMATVPAALLRQKVGSLKPGSQADLFIADLETEFVFRAADMASKARNTPFDGWTLRGRPVFTLCGGKVTHDER